MSYECRIEKDSLTPEGKRLTTMVVTYPRFVHSELMTHRQFSRNASSSRAIPVEKMIARAMEDPVFPVYWGKNQKGMQAQEELSEYAISGVRHEWREALLNACRSARLMSESGVHKQIVNRLLEPFSWITVIISATEWSNFFALRCHPDAQPELRHIAEMMQHAHQTSQPRLLGWHGWHLPFTDINDVAPIEVLKAISVARCARVSYLTQEGKRDIEEDIKLHDRLMTSGHWSPFEHIARPTYQYRGESNFRGWHQYRKDFGNECL